MPELVKLYKNLRDIDLGHILYKTKEGLQNEAFDYRGYYLSEHEYETVFAIYDEDTDEYFIIRGGDEDTDEYFIIRGGYHSKHSIGE